MTEFQKHKVLFVCLGNICRSPTAHGVFETKVEQRGLQGIIDVDSCGTGDWHIGHPPDQRSSARALTAGYDLSDLRARQLVANDYDQFDYVLAMDNANLRDIQKVFSTRNLSSQPPIIDLFLRFSLERAINPVSEYIDRLANQHGHEVPDPYFGGEDGFETVLELVEAASDALLDYLQSSTNNKQQ